MTEGRPNSESNQHSLTEVADYLADEHGLAVVSSTQADDRPLSSVVNCGVMDHPISGTPMVAFVSQGNAARLGHIRKGSPVTVAVRRGWKWRGVTGTASIIGPDDPADEIDDEQLRLLLRQVFQAAGGTHDDYEVYDQVMRDERRVAVFVAPDRVIGNG